MRLIHLILAGVLVCPAGAMAKSNAPAWNWSSMSSAGATWETDSGHADLQLDHGLVSGSFYSAKSGSGGAILFKIRGKYTAVPCGKEPVAKCYALTGTVYPQSSDRSPYPMHGTYRMIRYSEAERDGGGYDEVILLNEPYNSLGISRAVLK